jgi:hypothetical protein
MSYHERMRMMHERMKIRNLDIEGFIDTCVVCVESMEKSLRSWTDDGSEVSFLVECIFGDVLHDLDIIKKSARYMERLLEEEE